jgi:uncharacterized protein YidB (DUF937 family)
MSFFSMAKDLIFDENGGIDDGVMGALSKMIGSGDSMNISSLVDSMMSSNPELQQIASSWLGDGENMPISTQQVSSLFNSNEIMEFASKLNLDEEGAMGNIAEILPKIVDSSSSNGSLFDADNLNDLARIAQKLF